MELSNIGKLCHFETCDCKDFLPYKCSYCKNIFCTDHRSFTDHKCSHIMDLDVISIDCPKCNVTLKMFKKENEKSILKKHYENCSNKNEKKEEICGKIGCKTKLVFSNTYKCKKCNLDVCMQHRFEEEHYCRSLFETDNGLSKIGINILTKNLKI